MSYYIIKSKMHGLVLDVAGQGGSGAKVIPWERHGKDNQIWYDDPSTGTIRSKWNNCALTVEGDQLYVKDVQPGNNNQKWSRQGDVIKNTASGKVLDIFRENKEPGAQIGEYDNKGGVNQKWDFEMVGGASPGVAAAPAAPASPYYQGVKREFHIESLMNGKVLDVCSGKKDIGTKFCVWKKHSDNQKNQLFYLDAQGFIRSSLTDLPFFNKAKGDTIEVANADGNPRSQFHFQGNNIVNKAGECLDIRGGKDKDGVDVITWDSNNDKNQHWKQAFI